MVPQPWPAPLDRRIALRVRDISLREALDRVAAAGRFRVSYSAEFLPLDRRVCLASDSVVAGDALAELLKGVDVASIVTASDHVVLAPSHPVAQRESVQTLDRVVVTGSATGNAHRSLSVALDVVDGRRMHQEGTGSLSASFDGNVAGMWLWEQSPSSLLARYGSIRGASSFNVSYPKVYIDGIEVANPLLVTELNTATLDRIEVIRGPQGAALYGADAISGVVNILTRHEGLEAGGSRTEFVSRAGVSQTEFADRPVLAQNHSLTWRAGSNVKSGTLGMNLTTLGGYVPQAYSRDLKLNGGFRVVSSTASVKGTARFYGKRAAIGQNPLILGFLPQAVAAVRQHGMTRGPSMASREEDLAQQMSRESDPESVRQYTAGVTTTFLGSSNWTPSITIGLDGYRLANVPNDLGLLSSSLDTALHSAQGGADKGTLRASVVRLYDLGGRNALNLTFSAEHAMLRQTLVEPAAPDDSRPQSFADMRSNSGLVGQANLSLNETVYLTGGVRLEQNDGFTLSDKTVALPMLGATLVRDAGFATVKLRGAYGVGIRPAHTPTNRIALFGIGMNGLSTTLDPERQSGTELGADIFIAGKLGLHVTRFDQIASGLIQPVTIRRDSTTSSSGPGSSKSPRYVLQNVGEISNRGWEVESSLDLGAFNFSGAFTTVDSRVEGIARYYTGDLRVGDRMLAVPKGTASVSAGLNLIGFRASLTASRAFDWVNYDRLRLAKDFACDTCTAADPTGAQLRSYWMSYDGVTRLRLSASRDLRRELGLRLTVDNLTNEQRGEPDNITVLPGRTVLLGVSAKIR